MSKIQKTSFFKSLVKLGFKTERSRIYGVYAILENKQTKITVCSIFTKKDTMWQVCGKIVEENKVLPIVQDELTQIGYNLNIL